MTPTRLNEINDFISTNSGQPAKKKKKILIHMWWHYSVAQFWLMINRIIFRHNWTNASTYSRCFSTQIIPENTTNGLLQRFMQPYNPFYEEHYCQCKNAVHLQLGLENYKELHIILHLENALSTPHLKLHWSLLYNLTEISAKFLWTM